MLDEINRSQLLFLCVLPISIGLIMYYGALRRSRTTGLKPTRFIALVPLVIGLILGIFPVINLRDPIYVEFNSVGSKFTILHYVALGAPILGILCIVVTEMLLKRTSPRGGL